MSPMFWVWALRPSSSCSPDALAPLHLRTHRAADDNSQRSRHCRVLLRQQLEARLRSAAGKKAIARPLTNFCRLRASRPDAIVTVRAWRPHRTGTLAPGGTPSAQTVTFSPITRNALPAGIRYQRGAITEFGHLWTAPMIKAWSNICQIHARCGPALRNAVAAKESIDHTMPGTIVEAVVSLQRLEDYHAADGYGGNGGVKIGPPHRVS